MKKAGSLGLYLSLLLRVMEDSKKKSVRSKGLRMVEVIKIHIPCRNSFVYLTSTVWDVGR